MEFPDEHAQILLAVARDTDATVAELAETVQITERSAYRVLADLQKPATCAGGKSVATTPTRSTRRSRFAIQPLPTNLYRPVEDPSR